MLSLPTVVIYDHYESGCRAKAFLDQVAAKAGDEILFNLALWRMDSLAHPGSSTEVFRDLGRSILLVLALCPGGELPKSVFDWVECWAHFGAGDGSALVVLGNANTAALEELEQVAQRHGITLFGEPTTQPCLGWQNYIEGPQKFQQAFSTIGAAVPDDLHSRHYRHWGINE